jgi:predicted RNA-binding protein with PIN domain
MASAREYLLVDGHSIIFGWPELRALHSRRMASAREALVHTLTAYQDQSGVRVVLVFDGQGARASDDGEPGGIQIFYAPAGRTADDLIERLVAKYAAIHRLTVATSDRLEQQTALAFGAALCVTAEQLRDVLDASERDFNRRARAYRRGK